MRGIGFTHHCPQLTGELLDVSLWIWTSAQPELVSTPPAIGIGATQPSILMHLDEVLERFTQSVFLLPPCGLLERLDKAISILFACFTV